MKILPVITTIAATLLLANSASVNARSQAAYLGNPHSGNQQSCFYEASGGPVQRNCAIASWVMPIVYDSAGWKTIRVSAKGVRNTAQKVSCRFYSSTSTGVFSRGSSQSTVRHDGATEYLHPTGYAHGFGGTWVTCGLDRGTRLYNIHY